MRIILLICAVAGLLYLTYGRGYENGFNEGAAAEREQFAINNMEAVQRANECRRKLTYAGQLINAETGKPTGIPYYTTYVEDER